MCYNCWENFGSPKLDTPKIREAVSLVKAVYKEVSCVGGPLHIQFDDWNIDDGYFKEASLDLSMTYYPKWKEDLNKVQMDLCRKAYLAFKNLTLEERASALYWDEES